MTDVAEDFVLLEQEARDASGTQLWTRRTGVTVRGRDSLVAIDAVGQKHLLIPLVNDVVVGDYTSHGVILGSRVLAIDSDNVTFADLHCRIPSLDRVFERLAQDVLSRLMLDSSAPIVTCRKVLDEWRALLRTAGQTASRETVIGLLGELEVLRLFAVQDPVAALDAWQGPSKSVHDFVRAGAELEVKTTTSIDGNFVSISNIDQLDPALVESLHLVVVHAREDATALSLDERIDELLALSVPQIALLTKVAAVGYIYGSHPPTTADRFRIRSIRAWAVDDSFPGLRRGELEEDRLKGVSKIRYELALDSAPKRISDKLFNDFIVTWLSDR